MELILSNENLFSLIQLPSHFCQIVYIFAYVCVQNSHHENLAKSAVCFVASKMYCVFLLQREYSAVMISPKKYLSVG